MKIKGLILAGGCGIRKYPITSLAFWAVISRITLLGMISPSAWAYVDPGSGMLLWQGLIAAIGAVLIFLRNPLSIIRSLIDRIRRK